MAPTIWAQSYDLSPLVAALPLVALLGLLATGRVQAHVAALVGLGLAILVAVLLIHMPAGMAIRAALFGGAYGLFPIGWIILNVIFLYHLVEERGLFLRHRQEGIELLLGERLYLLRAALD